MAGRRRRGAGARRCGPRASRCAERARRCPVDDRPLGRRRPRGGRAGRGRPSSARRSWRGRRRSDVRRAGSGGTGRPSRSCTCWCRRPVPLWAVEPLGAAHRPGLALAEALEAARNGDLGPVRALTWPEVGIVRAHLPVRWIAELAAAATAARNPPPDDLLEALGPAGPAALRAIASSGGTGRVATAARSLAQSLPAVPPYRLRIGVLGPLRLWRDGVGVEHPELRRQRVRELLCYLVVHRRARREAVGEELWPDVADPGRNLRVTLNYLQTVLQPERARDQQAVLPPCGRDVVGARGRRATRDRRVAPRGPSGGGRRGRAGRCGDRRARRLPGGAAAVARRAVRRRPVRALGGG